MERTNATFLPLIEALGTRNQEQFFSEMVQAEWNVNSDVLANLQLVGQDNTGAVIAAGATSTVGVTVLDDTYITGIWVVEPQPLQDALVVQSAFVLRNQGGTFSQVTALHVRNTFIIGGANAWRRTWNCEGWPWGALARAGDVISVNVFNTGASATTTGLTVAYRGFKGPPG